MIDDVRPVVALVFVVADATVHAKANVAPVAASHCTGAEPWASTQSAVKHQASAHIVVVAIAPVAGGIFVNLNAVANLVHLVKRVGYTIGVGIVVESG